MGVKTDIRIEKYNTNTTGDMCARIRKYFVRNTAVQCVLVRNISVVTDQLSNKINLQLVTGIIPRRRLYVILTEKMYLRGNVLRECMLPSMRKRLRFCVHAVSLYS